MCLTILKRGAITFWLWGIMPSTSLTLLFSFLNGISSPAIESASCRPIFAIHCAHAHIAPAMSSTCTVCEGYFPGEFLSRQSDMSP